MTLAEIAPRLALARDQWLAEDALRQTRLQIERGNVLRLERLVGHRELQLIRAAGAGRSGHYLADRHRKLADAQAALRRARRRLHHLHHDRGSSPQEATA